MSTHAKNCKKRTCEESFATAVATSVRPLDRRTRRVAEGAELCPAPLPGAVLGYARKTKGGPRQGGGIMLPPSAVRLYAPAQAPATPLTRSACAVHTALQI